MATPKKILMRRPSHFGFNSETFKSNPFQTNSTENKSEISKIAQDEFDIFVKKLTHQFSVDVHIFEDQKNVITPDSVFMNNWISFFPGGKMVTYPMLTENRRIERDEGIIESFSQTNENLIRLELENNFEKNQKFLEGTGSVVYDHNRKVGFACRSPRTSLEVLDHLGLKIGYKMINFKAADQDNLDIYHTNVLLTICENFVIICKDSLDMINDMVKDKFIKDNFLSQGKEVIDISFDQLSKFCGNCFEVENKKGDKILIMSKTAKQNFSEKQILIIEKYCKICDVDIGNIEKVGGGSARCMVTGYF